MVPGAGRIELPPMDRKGLRAMQNRRALKAAEAIREVVSMAILAELKDPRIRDVTVTYVEVSADLRHAKVHVSVMGNEAKQQLSLRGLQSAAGFLQARCAARIDCRYTPRLQFILDQGVKKSIAMAQILQEVLPESSKTEASDTPAEAEGAPESENPPEGDPRATLANESGSAGEEGDFPPADEQESVARQQADDAHPPPES